MNTTERRVRVAEGVSLYVEKSGDGRPVVLLHGRGQSMRQMVHQHAAVSQAALAISVDLRGSGRSAATDPPYTMEALADDVAAVIESLDAAPAVVVGASLGGAVAGVLALRRPELVDSLVVISTPPGGPDHVDIPEETRRIGERAAGLPAEEGLRLAFPLSFAPGWPERYPQRYERLLRDALDHRSSEAGSAGLEAARDSFVEKGLPEGLIQQPTYIVHGTQDRVVPFENAEVLARHCADAAIHPMNNCGHLCWLERPHVVNRLVVAVATGADTTGLAV